MNYRVIIEDSNGNIETVGLFNFFESALKVFGDTRNYRDTFEDITSDVMLQKLNETHNRYATIRLSEYGDFYTRECCVFTFNDRFIVRYADQAQADLVTNACREQRSLDPFATDEQCLARAQMALRGN